MARSITRFEPTPAPVEEPATTPESARAELEELAELLHERGILRMVNGLLAAGPEVTEVALGTLGGPEGQRGLRNAILFVRALGEVELQQGMEGGPEPGGDPAGPLALLGRLRDPEVRAGLEATLDLLAAFGRLVSEPPPEHG